MTTEKFFPAAKYVPAIVLSMIIFGMKYHFETGIAITKKTRYFAYVNGVAMTVNLGLNWVLIRRFGISGAIISMNCSYLTTTLLSLFFSQKLYPVPFDYQKISFVFLGAVGAFALSLAIPSGNIVVSFAGKIILFIGYVAFVFICHILPREILVKLKSLFPLAT